MDREIFYGVQRLSLELNAQAINLGQEIFNPEERQFLLSDERQVYDLPEAKIYPDNLTVKAHLHNVCDDASETVRALRSGGRRILSPRSFGDLERIYQEIEGDSYQPPSSVVRGDLALLHGWLDLVQDLEDLDDTIVMYPELSRAETRERWRDLIDDLCHQISHSAEISRGYAA